ncbi:MAG: helix-turn-helix domain-containing protein [Smithellaceae bacterium]
MPHVKTNSIMERNFSRLNYYEMLDIRPEAVLFEIRHAYQNALQMYESGSLVSYSFFSEDERSDILAHIEKAYQTLTNEAERRLYDAELIRRGVIAASPSDAPVDKKPVSIFDISRGSAPKSLGQKHAEMKARIAENPRIGVILQKPDFCGADLQEIREALGVTLEQIAAETKIRPDYLRAIEASDASRLPAPVFLKGFVKAYLKYLCVEPIDELGAKYMNTLSASHAGIGS